MTRPAKMRITGSRSERDTKRPILEALRMLPAVVWVARVQSGRVKVAGGWMHLATIGSPDLVGGWQVGNGAVPSALAVLFGVEVKTAAGKQSPEQIETQARWTRRGAIYVVARDVSEAIEGIQAALVGR